VKTKRRDWFTGKRPDVLSMSADRVREMTARQQDRDIPQAGITERTTANNTAPAAYRSAQAKKPAACGVSNCVLPSENPGRDLPEV